MKKNIVLLILVTLLVVFFIGLFVYKNWYIEIKDNYIKKSVVDITRDDLFNTSYALMNKDGQVQFHGYGRPKKGHNKLYLKVIDSSGNIISPPKEVNLPLQVSDSFVGEVKGFTINDEFYVYTNFWGEKDNLSIFPEWASKHSIDLYFKSEYKNYLWNISTGKVIPLFYDILPGVGFTHKNFLFFQDKNETLVITSVSPHIIYKLDMDTGYMKLYSTTINNLKNFFDSDSRLSLSGGPVRIEDKGVYLVAGNISKGSRGGFRMTFFYTFKDSYPYEIISVSKPVSFGFSDSLEYCNNMFEYDGSLYLSIGINDNYSNLIQLNKNDIFNIMIKIKSKYDFQSGNYSSFVTFTTIPSRIKTEWFKNNLNRLLSITEGSQVILNIPDMSLKGEIYDIPQDIMLLQESKFIINYCEKDLGPITKLIPTLENDDIPDNAVIMVCDDDIKYRVETFQLLKNSILMHPTSISSMCSDVIEGYKAYGFIKKIMKGLVDLNIPTKCQRIDDDVIQQYVKKNNIKVIIVEYPGKYDGKSEYGGWKSCSTHDTTKHEEWEELRNDDREKIRKECLHPLVKSISNIQKPRIIDCFMVSTGEEDIMLLRIMSTLPYVYKYIIIDSDESHTGLKKPLINLDVIPKHLLHKVVYENIKFPENLYIKDPEKSSNSFIAWSREGYQRDIIMKHIHNIAIDTDFCYISDCDEIPFYDRILPKLSTENMSDLIHYDTQTYVYNIHFQEKGYFMHAPIGAFYGFLSRILLNTNVTLTNLRFEGVRKHDGNVIKLKHLEANKIEKGCVAHLNRFYNPAGLLHKNANIVEGSGKKENLSDTYRSFFRIVCDGQDGSPIDGTHIIKKKVVPDVPPLVHKYLHRIHTMSPTELTELHNKVKYMSDSEIKYFTETFFM